MGRVSLAAVGEQGAPVTPCPCRCHLSLEVKLNSSSGLLFYVAGEQGSFMALFVSNGRFVFLVHVGRRRLRLRSKDKYRDGRWHTVSGGPGLGRTSPSRIVLPCTRSPCTWSPTCSPWEHRGQENHCQGWPSLWAEGSQPWGSSRCPRPWH